MIRPELIKLVNGKTEQALVGQVDFDALLTEVIQEFCSEHRYWWRKKRFTFPTASGTDSYDFSDGTTITTTPAGIGPFIEEITFVGRVDGTKICTLDPIFNEQALAEWTVDPTTGSPGLYTVESNSITGFQTLRVHKIPNAVFTIHVVAWMMPNPDVNLSNEAIPIVPSIWHHVLQAGLEREIWRLKYGKQDPKFITANALYEKGVAAAKVPTSFSTEKAVHFQRNDGRAIRSTR